MQQNQRAGASAPLPSLCYELKRALNGYSLSVTALSTVALIGVLVSADQLQLFAFPLDWNAQSLAVTAGVIALALTLPHTLMHAYFGWRLGAGIAAFQRGQYKLAQQRLRIVRLKVTTHYDPHGHGCHYWQQLQSRME